MTTLLAMAAIACRPQPPARPAPADSGSAPPAPVPTSPTPAPIPPAFSAEAIPPSTVLVGTPSSGAIPDDGTSLGYRVGLLPAHGSDPAVMFLSHRSSPEAPGDVFLFPGDLPPGTHDYRDHLAGTLDHGFYTEADFVPVGDLDDDGHLDLWLYDRLLRGPFLGRDVVFDDETAVMITDSPFAGGFGGFDADHDGHTDMILDFYGWGFVFYGPFSGSMSAFHPDVSRVGSCNEANHQPWYALLPDLLGPGQDALAKGGTGCDGDTRLFPADIPRGTVWSDYDAFAENRGGSNGKPAPVEWIGDVDGDGVQDVSSGTSTGATAYRGPVVGAIGNLPEAIEWTWKDSVVGIGRQVGDVNGDGLPDMVAQVLGQADLMERPDWDWFVLLLSPLDPVIDPWADGIPIDRYENYDDLGLRHADLDGDGLSDLVSSISRGDGAGYVSIWYARDLLTHAPGLEGR